MKKIITLFALMLCLCATAQEVVDTMYIYRNDNVIERIPLSRIDSVVFVQPAAPDTPVTPPSTPQYEAIDLGLPSGVKWASFNVGANAPEEYGGYYAWGETEEKESYNEEDYRYYNNGSYTNIGSEISGTQYDVAHFKWGGDWRMPTLDEQQELINICFWEWTSINGVNGYKVTGPNGNSIFLPAAGYRRGIEVNLRGSYSRYWSSSLYSYYSKLAYSLDFDDGRHDWSYLSRYYGHSVRPVTE